MPVKIRRMAHRLHGVTEKSMEMQTYRSGKTVSIPVAFYTDEVPESVQILEPQIIFDSEYCCFLGEKLEDRIVGFGSTPQQAMVEWDKEFQRLKTEDKLPKWLEQK